MSDATRQDRQHLSIAWWIAVALQYLTGIIITFGDIGFDRPGQFGLSFGHFLILAVVALISFVVGVTMAAWARSPAAIAVVILGAVFSVAGVIISG